MHLRLLNRVFCSLLLSISLATEAKCQINRFDIVIDELLPDPSPSVGLPAYEFVELKNVSRAAINLKNWKLTDGSSTATINTNYLLLPDSFVVICSTTAASSFLIFGSAIGVTNFPSLNNDEDEITLIAPDQRVIHSVKYSDEWFNNAVKSDGGWSLEMIDTKNPCGGALNWKPSENSKGGTPGRKNSVEGNNVDHVPPRLLRMYCIDSLNVVAVFNEALDSFTAVNSNNYSFTPQLQILKCEALAPSFSEVRLTIRYPIERQKIYVLKTVAVSDCSGNPIGSFNSAKVGLPSIADSLDLVINEILFNPKSDGTDYLETYNRSKKVFDASKLYVASRNSSGAITSMKKFSEKPLIIFPGDYFTLTEDPQLVSRVYFLKNPEQLLKISALPSFPDDEGDAIVLNEQGKIIDELRYSEKWHFALTTQTEGIALERIDPNSTTNSPENWSSAASSAGFGTPTGINSQNKISSIGKSQVTVTPSVFSPDNDGHDDYCFIKYQLDNTGFLATISVFDLNGRLVRKIMNGQTLQQNGFIKWDGMNDLGGKAPAGAYLVLTQIFNLQGRSKKFRYVVALARKN